MNKYTKYGKHRYNIFRIDKKGNVIKSFKENISNKNVIDIMHSIGINDCNRHGSDLQKSWAKERKTWLNDEGFLLFNSSGYYTDSFIAANTVVIDKMQENKYSTTLKNFIKKQQQKN